MGKFIKAITREGVKTYNDLDRKPHPGDPVDFSDYDEYPFERDFGRIDEIGRFGKDTYHICTGGASVYLNESGSVSISGGPFSSIHPDELIETDAEKIVEFWNFGDNIPGAGMGVYFSLPRPVWKLKLRAYSWRCPKYNNEYRVREKFETVKCTCCELFEGKETFHTWEDTIVPIAPDRAAKRFTNWVKTRLSDGESLMEERDVTKNTMNAWREVNHVDFNLDEAWKNYIGG